MANKIRIRNELVGCIAICEVLRHCAQRSRTIEAFQERNPEIGPYDSAAVHLSVEVSLRLTALLQLDRRERRRRRVTGVQQLKKMLPSRLASRPVLTSSPNYEKTLTTPSSLCLARPRTSV